MERQKRLIDRFEIPINHLDFAYIGQCKDAREMEKILHILRSGEEGYYPDLTKCAEDKLRELKPDSKLFRFEEPLKGRNSLRADEWKPIYDWTKEIKTKDNKLADIKKQEANDIDLDLPPIRKSGKISDKSDVTKDTTAETKTATDATKSTERIKSTDYNKWDKYNPDVEMLKMDLAEERVQEEVERKNIINLQKSKTTPNIIELTGDEAPDKELEMLKKLTDVEREKLAEEYRLRGNEYFKTKDYNEAIEQYSRSIKMNPATAAPSYNNRAIANIKLQKYLNAIDDCEQCLLLEPDNMKAWLRKAESSYCYGRRREAYDIYLKVLDLDGNNAIALKATEELRSQLGDLPPPHATRLQIKEDSSNSKMTTKKSPQISNTSKAAKKPPPKPKDYDLAKLIVPNRVVNNKLSTAAAALGKSLQRSKPCEAAITKPSTEYSDSQPELRLPTAMPTMNSGQLLIEEI